MPGEPQPATPPRSIWLLSDVRRSVIAAGLSVLVTFPLQLVMLDRSPALVAASRSDLQTVVLLALVLAVATLSLIYAGLTVLAFSRLSGPRFAAAVTADPGWQDTQRSGWRRWARLLSGSGPSSWAVATAVMSLGVVVTLVQRTTFRDLPFALPVALSMVAVSWLTVAVMSAVNYARVDHDGRSLGFSGSDPRTLSDYLYLALATQMTFGTTDTEVRSTRMRRLITGQAVLAFVFNTVIIAMIVSLLLGEG